jgi:hypothetical protein
VLVAAVVAVVVAGGPALLPASPAGAAAPRSEATAALDWIEAELSANEHGMPGFTAGAYDWGLTSDAVLALASGGRSRDAETVATTANLLDHASNYATWDDLGSDYPGVRIAGAFGKLNLVAEVQGVDDPAQTDGFDLEAEVRATMEVTGAQAGRFSDIDPHFGSNNANGFGQALAMLGLSYSDDGVPSQAVTFLIDQQCPSGGFRLTYRGTAGCASDGSSDTDTSAMAIQALLVADRTPAVRAALVKGLDWLESQQDASGGWGGTGPTSNLNANSSGLTATALRAAGRTGAAADGSDWIAGAALTAANTGAGPAKDEVGAIAYTYASRDAAITAGIDAGGRDQWRRATAQAVLGLGLPEYGSINREPAAPVVASHTAAGSFVIAASTDFLGRPPTETELATQAAKVTTTSASRAAVVKGLAESDEWIGQIVVGFYEDTLGRGPDPSGKAFWINQLRSGRRTVAQAAAEFYASSEYFRNRGGNTVPTWVTDLYDRLLHRAPDTAGKAFWVNRTATRGRVVVAGQMYQSAESRRDRVTRLYVALLGRQPDPAGRDYWAGRILTQGDIALAINLASSNEYLAKAAVRFP